MGRGPSWRKCRFCCNNKRKCKKLDNCPVELKCVTFKSQRSNWVCPDCSSPEDIERIVDEARSTNMYMEEEEVEPQVQVAAQVESQVYLDPVHSQHVHALLVFGFTIINAICGMHDMERARTSLNGAKGPWRALFNDSVRVQDPRRQTMPLPKTPFFNALIEDTVEKLRTLLVGWAAFTALSPTAIRSAPDCPEQHLHSDNEPAELKGMPLLARPLSMILSLTTTKLRVWPVKEWGTSPPAAECKCICDEQGITCPRVDGGQVLTLEAGSCVVFVGDLLHAGGPGFPDSLSHPRIHCYLQTAGASSPVDQTFPCDRFSRTPNTGV